MVATKLKPHLLECTNYSPTTILIFFTGRGLPEYTAGMLRDPKPSIGITYDENFPLYLKKAIQENSSIHDGAVLLRRATQLEKYSIVDWSLRLFPPNFGSGTAANQGSAFNSCLEMSCVEGVECVVVVSRSQSVEFKKGQVAERI